MPPPFVDESKFFHGINAFASSPVTDNWRRLIRHLGQSELSTSTTLIGPVGVVLSGDIKVASDTDVFSWTNNTERLWDQTLYTPPHIRRNPRSQGIPIPQSTVSGSHNEVVLKAQQIHALTFNRGANPLTNEHLWIRRQAQRRGIPVLAWNDNWGGDVGKLWERLPNINTVSQTLQGGMKEARGVYRAGLNEGGYGLLSKNINRSWPVELNPNLRISANLELGLLAGDPDLVKRGVFVLGKRKRYQEDIIYHREVKELQQKIEEAKTIGSHEKGKPVSKRKVERLQRELDFRRMMRAKRSHTIPGIAVLSQAEEVAKVMGPAVRSAVQKEAPQVLGEGFKKTMFRWLRRAI